MELHVAYQNLEFYTFFPCLLSKDECRYSSVLDFKEHKDLWVIKVVKFHKTSVSIET